MAIGNYANTKPPKRQDLEDVNKPTKPVYKGGGGSPGRSGDDNQMAQHMGRGTNSFAANSNTSLGNASAVVSTENKENPSNTAANAYPPTNATIAAPTVTAAPTATAGSPSSALNETSINANDPLANVTGYDATKSELESADTVEGRVAGLLDQDNKLMQIAKTKADQQSNSKGLLNSSMAVGAAQMAQAQQAESIAAADAKASVDMKLANTEAENRAKEFTSSEINKGKGLVYQGELDEYLQSEQGQIDLSKIAANIEGDSRLLNEKGEIDLTLQDDLFVRQTELQQRKAEIDELLIKADGVEKSRLQEEAGEIDKEINEINNAYEQQLLDQKAEIDLMLQDASAEDALVLEEIKGRIDKEISHITGGYNVKTAQISAQARIQAASIAAASAANVAQINGKNALLRLREEGSIMAMAAELKVDTDAQVASELARTDRIVASKLAKTNLTAQGLSSATNLGVSLGQEVLTIANSPNMNTAQKKDAITNAQERYKNGMDINDLAYGVDLSDAIVLPDSGIDGVGGTEDHQQNNQDQLFYDILSGRR